MAKLSSRRHDTIAARPSACRLLSFHATNVDKQVYLVQTTVRQGVSQKPRTALTAVCQSHFGQPRIYLP